MSNIMSRYRKNEFFKYMSKLLGYLTLLLMSTVSSIGAGADATSLHIFHCYIHVSDQFAHAGAREKIKVSDTPLSPRLDQLDLLNKEKGASAELQVVQINKMVVGELEWVYVHELGQSFKARVDSGATTSSISATDLEAFERNNTAWVRFTVNHPSAGKFEQLEAPVVRQARIKQASASGSQSRLVVSLTVNLGEHFTRKTEFTLADRRNMSYPMLLGREFLSDVAVVDVGKKFLHAKVESKPK